MYSRESLDVTDRWDWLSETHYGIMIQGQEIGNLVNFPKLK